MKLARIELEPVNRFLAGAPELPIVGDDPRHPGRRKVFSAAPIVEAGEIQGYLYVILESEEYAIAADGPWNSNALRLSGRERVLEVGTGSGYQAAVLSLLAREVFSIEIVEPLGLEARQRLKSLGYENVQVRIGDGYAGWPERAPFDRVILTAAPPKIPKALVTQLRDGGIIVAPVGETEQVLVRWIKRGERLIEENHTRFGDHRSGQRDPLRFPPGEVLDAALTET